MKTNLNTIALSAALLITPCTASVVTSYSIDFHGTVQPDTLAPGQSAGVISATNWDPAIGLSGGGSAFDNTGSGPTMSYGWNSPLDGTIAGSTSTIGDEDMMEGYLMTRSESSAITVQFSIAPLATLGWDYYDIYVYSNRGTASTPTSTINLFPGGGGSPISYTHSDRIPGYGAGTPDYFDSQVDPTGNYVVYSGRLETTQAITIQAPPLTSAGAGEGYLNGIQIVGYQIPEPSTGLLAILSSITLLARRKRHC